MKTIIENLYYEHTRKMKSSKRVKELEQYIENNRNQLKVHLSKKEKVILLRILDAKDSIIDEASYHGYVNGFNTGLKIGYEVNRE